MPGWRRVTLYATVMGMEGCAFYVLLMLLDMKVAGGILSIAGLLSLYALAFGFNLLLRRLRLRRVYGNIVNTLAWLIVMLLTVKVQLYSQASLFDNAWLMAVPQAFANILHAFDPALLILLISAVIWWAGRRLAIIRLNFPATVSEFQFGLAVILIIFFFAAQLGVELSNSITAVLSFSLSALLAISIAHAGEGTGWLSGLNQGHWVGLLLVSIGIILIIGLLIGSVITPDLLHVIMDWLKWVWNQIMKGIIFLVSLLPTPEPTELPLVAPAPEVDSDALVRKAVEGFIPKAVRDGLRIGWTILVSGAIIMALWRVSSDIFGWLRRKLTNMSGGEVEPLTGAFMADILSLLRRILLKLFGIKLTIRLKGRAGSAEVTPVRQIYRHMLHWVAGRGWPRPVFQTPYEYLITLEELMPASGDALKFITQQYVSDRYGMLAPSEEELHRIREDWHHVKKNHLKHPDKEENNPEHV